jgi:arsenite methyltransferase
MDANKIYQSVQNHYGLYAKRSITEGDAKYSQMVAQAFGYSLKELTSIPEGANLGVSCGNPFATANLKEVRLKYRVCYLHSQ